MRLPERDRVYAAVVDAEALSTKLSDWIEKDLLQLDPEDIRTVTINDYRIDEINRQIVPGDLIELRFDDAGRKWALIGMAESETFAHLEHLRIAGDAERHTDNLGRYVYETG